MTTERTLKIGDLTPGCTVSGAHSEVYFDPSAFRCYEFSNVGSGQPMDAFSRKHLRIGSIPLDLADGEWLADVVRGFEDSLRDIADGHDVYWDGNNYRGRLTEEASETLERVQEEFVKVLEEAPTFWDAGEWFEPVRAQVVDDILRHGCLDKWAAEEEHLASDTARLNEDDVLRYGADRLRETIEEWESSLDHDPADDDDEDAELRTKLAAAKKILADKF